MRQRTKRLRPSSDVVLLPRPTKKHGRSTASESNFWIKFDKLCGTARLWHGSDSNIVPLPCQTKFINYIYAFWRNYLRARSYEETTRRPRGEFSFTEYVHWMLPEVIPEVLKNMAALQFALNSNATKNKPEGRLSTRNVFLNLASLYAFYNCSNHP